MDAESVAPAPSTDAAPPAAASSPPPPPPPAAPAAAASSPPAAARDEDADGDGDEDEDVTQRRRHKRRSRFVEAEAGEDEDEEDGGDGAGGARKKKLRRVSTGGAGEDDSSEEEEDDDGALTEEDKRFIVADDNVDEGEGAGEGESAEPRRRRDDDEMDDELDEEDLELVRESQMSSKKSRLQKRGESLHALAADDDVRADDDDDDDARESDEDDFIEETEEIQRERIRAAVAGKRAMVEQDSALRELQDLFGDQYFGLVEDDQAFTQEAAPKAAPLLSDLVEPSVLAERMQTQQDLEVLACDMPERLQPHYAVRGSIDKPTTAQLETEAAWIMRQAPFSERADKIDLQQAINSVLVQLRRELHEVSFIYHYRRDMFVDVLSLDELWKVFELDTEWRMIAARKRKVANEYSELTASQAVPHDAYFEEQLESAETDAETKDACDYYAIHIAAAKGRATLKKNTVYSIAREEPDVVAFAKKFGVTAQQFGESLKQGYRYHDPEDPELLPEVLAESYVTTKFRKPSHVVIAARELLTVEIANDPQVRKWLRDRLRLTAAVTVRPTAKGRKEIDRFHEYADVKYITSKPVSKVEGAFFLRLLKAERDGLLTISLTSISSSNASIFSELRECVTSSGTSDISTAWNAERTLAVKAALDRHLAPMLESELRTRLESESSKYVARQCQERLERHLMVAPYAPAANPVLPLRSSRPKPTKKKQRSSRRRSGSSSDESEASDSDEDDEGDDDDYARSVREVPQGVLAISWLKDDGSKDVMLSATMGAMLTRFGDVRDTIRLENLRQRNTRAGERGMDLIVSKEKQDDLNALQDFIVRHRPAVLIVGTLGLDARRLYEDLTRLTQRMQEYSPPVLYVDDEVAVLYGKSPRSTKEFPDFPPLLHYCISLGRCMLDPLSEFAGLVSRANNDLVYLRLHPQQGMVPREELKAHLERALLNSVAAAGVDLNRVLPHSHMHGVLPFVPGLGFRRAFELIETASHKRIITLRSRIQLLEQLEMLATVFDNCSAFLKIDPNVRSKRGKRRRGADDDSEYPIDVLDRTRIHRESYVFARRMAADALEKELPEDELESDSAIVEQLQLLPDGVQRLHMFSDEQLREYANKLAEMGDWRRVHTLRMLQRELGEPFKELRQSYMQPADLFELLTGESDDTLRVGLLVSAVVTRVSDVRIDVRLDSGLFGEVFANNVLDEGTPVLTTLVAPGDLLQGRVLNVDKQRFTVELTMKPRDVLDTRRSALMGRRLDAYYDERAHEQDMENDALNERRKARKARARMINHEAFRDYSYLEAEQHLADAPVGQYLLRPSSEGNNFLAVTVKMGPGLFLHIHVRSEESANTYDIFGRALYIGSERFNDVDEVLARYVQPMGMFMNDALQHRKYRNTTPEELAYLVNKEKEANANAIPYYICQNPQQPDQLTLVYRPGDRVRQEVITVTPNGFRFRHSVNRRYFSDLNDLFDWFKQNYRNFNTPVAATATAAAAAMRMPAALPYPLAMGTR